MDTRLHFQFDYPLTCSPAIPPREIDVADVLLLIRKSYSRECAERFTQDESPAGDAVAVVEGKKESIANHASSRGILLPPRRASTYNPSAGCCKSFTFPACLAAPCPRQREGISEWQVPFELTADCFFSSSPFCTVLALLVMKF